MLISAEDIKCWLGYWANLRHSNPSVEILEGSFDKGQHTTQAKIF